MPHSPQEFYKKMELKTPTEKGIKKFNRIKGDRGEKMAAKFLKRSGYKILERNYRSPFGEVDIIAGKGDVVAFVEVKTRSSDRFGLPSEAVDRRRMERYANAARFYFSGMEIGCTVRFDVIEVFGKEINHIVSAFEAH